jgi:hypothetical protein
MLPKKRKLDLAKFGLPQQQQQEEVRAGGDENGSSGYAAGATQPLQASTQ